MCTALEEKKNTLTDTDNAVNYGTISCEKECNHTETNIHYTSTVVGTGDHTNKVLNYTLALGSHTYDHSHFELCVGMLDHRKAGLETWKIVYGANVALVQFDGGKDTATTVHGDGWNATIL